MSERWLRVLDEYEAVLADQAALVVLRGDGVATAFAPPADLPPLPPELEPRVAGLARRTADLAGHAGALARELEPGRPAAPGGVSRPAGAATFDLRA